MITTLRIKYGLLLHLLYLFVNLVLHRLLVAENAVQFYQAGVRRNFGFLRLRSVLNEPIVQIFVYIAGLLQVHCI